jgi:hypothetical protein
LEQDRNLSFLRQGHPDATEEEVVALARIYATDYRWRRWYPETDRQLRDRVEASGRPIRDCMFEIAQEIKSLPRDTVLLNVARGADLVPLVNELMRLQGEWKRQYDDEERRKKWLAEGKALNLYDPDTGIVKVSPGAGTETQVRTDTGQSVVLGPDGKPLSSGVIVVGESDVPRAPLPASIQPPLLPPPPSPPDDQFYPEGIDFDRSIIVWAEEDAGEPFDPPGLLAISKEAAVIACHRAKTGKWDASVLRDLAAAAKQPLDGLTEPGGPAAATAPAEHA